MRPIHALLPALLVLATLAPSVRAEGEDPLVQKRDAKLSEAWIKKAAWFTDYGKAKAEAKATGKPIFAYFTRSYSY